MGGDEQFLIPICIARLSENPIASGSDRDGEMLSAVLECDAFDWKAQHECVHRIREIADAALGKIAEGNGNGQTLIAGWHLYRSLSVFERRLNSVP
jgi:hypothetical protein